MGRHRDHILKINNPVAVAKVDLRFDDWIRCDRSHLDPNTAEASKAKT